jgi:hypothetical protein
MRTLWSGPEVEFHGEFVDFPKVTCSPRPVQASIPILVGGDSDVAIRRAARLADGYFPGEGDADRLASLITRVRHAADDAGRDPDSIEINAMLGQHIKDPAVGVEKFIELGVGRAMVPAFFFAGPGGLDRMEQFAETALAAAS